MVREAINGLGRFAFAILFLALLFFLYCLVVLALEGIEHVLELPMFWK